MPSDYVTRHELEVQIARVNDRIGNLSKDMNRQFKEHRTEHEETVRAVRDSASRRQWVLTTMFSAAAAIGALLHSFGIAIR